MKTDLYYYNTQSKQWQLTTIKDLAVRNDPDLLIRLIDDDGSVGFPIKFGDFVRYLQQAEEKPAPRPILGTVLILAGLTPIIYSIMAGRWFYIIFGIGLILAGIRCLTGESGD